MLRESIEAKFSVQNESIAAEFTTVRNEIIETASGLEERVVEIEDHVVIEPGAKVTLSSSAMSTKTIITPDGLEIADKSDQTLADFTSAGAFVPRIKITQQMSLGNLMWVVHSNNTSSIMAN